MARNAKIGLFALAMSFNSLSPLAYGQTGSVETWEATAYCRCKKCCGKDDGITASGKPARAGHTVAMNGIPLGTKVRINGKVYVVEDRGAVSRFGSFKHPKKRVDIFMTSHAEAIRFGRRKVKLEVLDG